MSTKRGKCPQCCPEGGAIFTAAYNDEMEPVWECNNCFTELPRRVRAYKRNSLDPEIREHVPLTAAQIDAVTTIQLYKLRDGCYGRVPPPGENSKEIKRFSVQQMGFCVSVVCEVGLVGDEGKLASIYCRDKGHFFVFPRGRIEVAGKAPAGKKKSYKQYPLIYGWKH